MLTEANDERFERWMWKGEIKYCEYAFTFCRGNFIGFLNRNFSNFIYQLRKVYSRSISTARPNTAIYPYAFFDIFWAQHIRLQFIIVSEINHNKVLGVTQAKNMPFVRSDFNLWNFNVVVFLAFPCLRALSVLLFCHNDISDSIVIECSMISRKREGSRREKESKSLKKKRCL